MMLAHPFLPFDFSGLRLEAVRHAAVGHDEEIIANGNGRGHIGDAAIGAPDDFRFCDVSMTVRLYRQNMMIRKAASHEEQAGLFVVDDGSDELLGWSIDNPMQLAV